MSTLARRESTIARTLVTAGEHPLGNLAVAYLLLIVVGALELHRVADFAAAAAGFGLTSVNLARSLTRPQGPGSA